MSSLTKIFGLLSFVSRIADNQLKAETWSNCGRREAGGRPRAISLPWQRINLTNSKWSQNATLNIYHLVNYPLFLLGPLDLVETLRLASGVGADCTLLPGMNEQIFNDFTVPNFLYPDWCLVQRTPVEQVLGSRDANASFSSAIKTFPQKQSMLSQCVFA